MNILGNSHFSYDYKTTHIFSQETHMNYTRKVTCRTEVDGWNLYLTDFPDEGLFISVKCLSQNYF